MKKDKETLAIIKKMISDGCITKDVAEKYFTKLKEESENENIRKEIIDFIKNSHNYWQPNDSIAKKWVSWLEKQGESIKIKKGKNYLCTKTHKYAGVDWREGIKYYSPEDYSLVNQGCICYCPKYSKEEHNNFFKEVEYDGCLEKQGEQKSAWSEEDKKMFEHVEHALDMIEWYSGMNESKSRAVSDWFKSLKYRYTWKPSEEQINALAKNVEYVNVSCTQPILKGLLEDLKKLREEDV